MRCYSTLKQFVLDYLIVRIAKNADPGREGETVASYMKKRIDSRKAIEKTKDMVYIS